MLPLSIYPVPYRVETNKIIDLEFKDTAMQIPPLPFATKANIYADNPNTTQAERNWIKQLWEDEWQSVKLTT